MYHDGSYLYGFATVKEAKAKQRELGYKRDQGERVIVATRLRFEDVAKEWMAFAKAQPRSASTIANRLKPLSGIFAYAVFPSRYISSAANPISALRASEVLPSCNAKREDREWTTEEVDRLIRMAYERDTREEARGEYGLSIELILGTGLRLGELLGLQYHHLIGDRDARVLLVRRQLKRDGKTKTLKTKSLKSPRPAAQGSRPQDQEAEARAGRRGRGINLRSAPRTEFAESWQLETTGLESSRQGRWTNGRPEGDSSGFTPRLRLAGSGSWASSDDVAGIVGHTSSKVTEGIYKHAFNRDEREQRQREIMARMAGGTP